MHKYTSSKHKTKQAKTGKGLFLLSVGLLVTLVSSYKTLDMVHASTLFTSTIPLYADDNFILYDSSDITDSIIVNRDGKVIIEKVIGICLDDSGNGKVINSNDDDYNYISYSTVNNVKAGDTVVSYLVYNPDTLFIDDVSARYDYIQ